MQNWQQVRRGWAVPLANWRGERVNAGDVRALHWVPYCSQNIEQTVSGMSRAALVTQFGGARCGKAKTAPGAAALPSQSLLVPVTSALALRRHRFRCVLLSPTAPTVSPSACGCSRPSPGPYFSATPGERPAHQLVNELHKGDGVTSASCPC